jgi:hypothetical protein
MSIKYMIKKGDNLSGIAKAHNITLGELLKANSQLSKNGRNPGLIYVGEVIKIPKSSELSKTNNLKMGQETCPKESASDALKNIFKTYQVNEDNKIIWSPKILGVIPVTLAGEHQLTETEGRLLDNLSLNRGVLGLMTFNDIKNQAFDISESHYPDPLKENIPNYVPKDRQQEWIGNDGHRDAFRHAYWNGLLTHEFGGGWTKEFATAHEAYPKNPGTREAMDLYNNHIGRKIALENSNVNSEELANLIGQAVDNGELVVIDKCGNLAWSNQVPLYQHGFTDGVSVDGAIAVPGGQASAQ